MCVCLCIASCLWERSNVFLTNSCSTCKLFVYTSTSFFLLMMMYASFLWTFSSLLCVCVPSHSFMAKKHAFLVCHSYALWEIKLSLSLFPLVGVFSSFLCFGPIFLFIPKRERESDSRRRGRCQLAIAPTARRTRRVKREHLFHLPSLPPLSDAKATTSCFSILHFHYHLSPILSPSSRRYNGDIITHNNKRSR